MKLALIIDDYLPNSTRVGAKMFHELAVELVSYGHSVTVITPDSKCRNSLEYSELDAVRVWRFKSGLIKDVSRILRAFNETLLSFRAWNAIKDIVKPETFDGIIYYSPSIFWGQLVNRLKKRCNCQAYLILRDLFPQWVIDAGMLRSGTLLEKYFRLFEKYSYHQADIIGLMSERNLQVFQETNKNLPCEILHNWANISSTNPSDEGYIPIRERLRLQNKTIFFYGGNIGHAQDMANLMRLAKSMQYYENAHFLFVGQGDEVELIHNLSAEWSLTNFSYLPSVNQNEFKCILNEVDVGLFSLAAHHTTHNFPGKLLGYMVQSLPILGSVNQGNDLLDIVNSSKAGFIHINGEDKALLQSAEKLYLDTELRLSTGHNSYELLRNKFSVCSAARTIEARLEVKKALVHG